MTLSSGGQRLVGIASRMINLAAEAEDAVRRASGAPDRLRVVATSTVAEFVVPPLLEALAQRGGFIESTVGVASTSEMAALLQERLPDVAIGPRLVDERSAGLISEPIFRYRLLVIAASAHRLAQSKGLTFRDLVTEQWMVDPAGVDPSTEKGQLLTSFKVTDSHIRVLPNEAAALAAIHDGQGIGLAIGHLVQPDIDRGRLVALQVYGTPIELLWYASMLAGDRRNCATAVPNHARGDASNAPQRRRRATQPISPARLCQHLELDSGGVAPSLSETIHCFGRGTIVCKVDNGVFEHSHGQIRIVVVWHRHSCAALILDMLFHWPKVKRWGNEGVVAAAKTSARVGQLGGVHIC